MYKHICLYMLIELRLGWSPNVFATLSIFFVSYIFYDWRRVLNVAIL
jgi:hypothetical protein